MHHQLKRVLGRILYGTGAHAYYWRNRALITTFHTIRERADTPIGCTQAEFVAYCDFFREHFRVVSLTELLARLQHGQDISRHLCITFDDGYRDNAEFAAGVLEERGLPATFFVVTDFIGSDYSAWWDWELGIRSRWMSWDQVRDLHRRGFAIGCHTASHPDLGAVPADLAEADLRAALDRLEQELGTRTTLFAYPYGRKDNINEANLERVKRCGFTCCLSSCGGIVEAGADPFRLERIGISPWFKSVYQLGFEAASLARLRGRGLDRAAANGPGGNGHLGSGGGDQQVVQPEGLLYR